ncbi:unnamed protein product, partial [Symbiodinium sp. KB8]
TSQNMFCEESHLDDADVDVSSCWPQEFDDRCPPLQLAGYKLVLRGSWSRSIEVAIQISVQRCAFLCTADPECRGFSLDVDERGVCSHYEEEGDPKPSSSCTYAFSKAKPQPNPQTQGEDQDEEAEPKKEPSQVVQHSVHSKDSKKIMQVRGSRGRDGSGGSRARPRGEKQDRRMDTIPEPVLGSGQVQDAHVADRQAAAFNAIPGAQLLPDPPESDGYTGKKPGPEVLFLQDPRKWPASMKAKAGDPAARSSLVQVPALHLHRHLAAPEWKMLPPESRPDGPGTALHELSD